MRSLLVVAGRAGLDAHLEQSCVGARSAERRTERVIREPRQRLLVTPLVTPYWDSYVVPRYRYRPEDDRVDPYGPPVVPVIRYGNQEITVRPWYW